jgi:hypothetical protein
MGSFFRIVNDSDRCFIIFFAFPVIKLTNDLSKVYTLFISGDFYPGSCKLVNQLLRILNGTIKNTSAWQIVVMAGDMFPLAACVYSGALYIVLRLLDVCPSPPPEPPAAGFPGPRAEPNPAWMKPSASTIPPPYRNVNRLW